MFVMFSFASASSVFELDENVNITVVCLNDGFCSNASECYANVLNPNGIYVIDNQLMNYTTSFHYLNYTPEEIGVYHISGYCMDGILYDEIDFTFRVNLLGKENISPAADIILFFFFFFILIGLVYFKRSTNFEKWYTGIIKKYETRNFVKVALSAMGYTLMKNTFVLYYIVGFPMLIAIYNVTMAYDVLMLVDVMRSLVWIYAIYFVVVGIYFLSYVQEIVIELIEDFANEDWGIGK